MSPILFKIARIAAFVLFAAAAVFMFLYYMQSGRRELYIAVGLLVLGGGILLGAEKAKKS